MGSLGPRLAIQSSGKVVTNSDMNVRSDIGTSGSPSLLVSTLSSNANDTIMSVRGSRSGLPNASSSKIRLENFDSDLSRSGIMGSIHGHIKNSSTNIGELHFYTSPDGLMETLCMKMTGITNRVGIGVDSPTEKLDVSGNIKCNGTCSASTYAGLPTATTGSKGVVMIGSGVLGDNLNITGSGLLSIIQTNLVTENSGALVTSGGVYSALTDLTTTTGTIVQTQTNVGDFDLNIKRDMNAEEVYYTWDNQIDNYRGITHTNSTDVETGSLFTSETGGQFQISVNLVCSDSGGSTRTFLNAWVRIYYPEIDGNGFSTTSRGGLDYSVFLGCGYNRGLSGTNQVSYGGNCILTLSANEQFEIVSTRQYSHGGGKHIDTDIALSSLHISKITHTLS